MKRLHSLIVTQTRILPADDLPFVALLTQTAIEQIQQAFSFRQAMPVQPPIVPDPAGGLSFWGGQLEIDSIPVAISQITIEPRKITVATAGSSDKSNRIYELLADLIRRLDSRAQKPLLEPIVLTEETVTVLELDFPITRLFEDGRIAELTRDAAGLVDKVTSRISVVPAGITFRVSYLDPGEKIQANNIQLIDKELKIERRVNTAPDENMFFISSPNGSETHMKLVGRLEEVFREPK